MSIKRNECLKVLNEIEKCIIQGFNSIRQERQERVNKNYDICINKFYNESVKHCKFKPQLLI